MYSAFPGSPEEVPSGVEKAIGRIREAEYRAPGIFYVSAQGNGVRHGGEYYLVQAGSVPAEAETFGETMPDCPQYLLYPIDAEPQTRKVIEYEIQLSGVKGHCRTPERAALRESVVCAALRETALYGMGECPAYFGTYPAPLRTPYGYTVRYKTLMNGVFRADTDRGIQTLAISFPVWEDIFSRYVRRLANGEDVRRDRDGYGFLYFEGKSVCLALFELRLSYRALRDSPLTDPAALMNAVWTDFPDYAARFNLLEQGGTCYMPGRMFSEGTDSGHMIRFTPDAGTLYWRL